MVISEVLTGSCGTQTGRMSMIVRLCALACGRGSSCDLASGQEPQREPGDGILLWGQSALGGRHWASLIGQGVLFEEVRSSVAVWEVKLLSTVIVEALSAMAKGRVSERSPAGALHTNAGKDGTEGTRGPAAPVSGDHLKGEWTWGSRAECAWSGCGGKGHQRISGACGEGAACWRPGRS
ncbi:Transmembrane protein 41B [Fukomys damarensis]|uniref:Transmembrane protein 41B n=1 Tax=Fukomys damarensis TaxID=885580 RepID=A0A091CLP5_FUKDA|nr:Transmembrane protein 41B [Fukomys damarensis]